MNELQITYTKAKYTGPLDISSEMAVAKVEYIPNNIQSMKTYTQEHLNLIVAVEKAETKLSIYNQLAQSWDEGFEEFMECKIEKAESMLEKACEKLEKYEKEITGLVS